MQVLYETDMTDHPWDQVLERSIAAPGHATETLDYAQRLVTGVMAERIVIDGHLKRAAPTYPISQLSPVDRNVLRLAIYELMREPSVPTKVAINEAVELGKRFGGENSHRFVNGVIGTIASQVRDADENTSTSARA
jgi:N utilization substance protein B